MTAKRPKIGTVLKLARVRAGLDQLTVRDRVRAYGPPLDKTHLQTISNIEQDKQFPAPELLQALCEVLGVRSLPLTGATEDVTSPDRPVRDDAPSMKEGAADVLAAIQETRHKLDNAIVLVSGTLEDLRRDLADLDARAKAAQSARKPA